MAFKHLQNQIASRAILDLHGFERAYSEPNHRSYQTKLERAKSAVEWMLSRDRSSDTSFRTLCEDAGTDYLSMRRRIFSYLDPACLCKIMTEIIIENEQLFMEIEGQMRTLRNAGVIE